MAFVYINPNNTQAAPNAFQHWDLCKATDGTLYAILLVGTALQTYRSTNAGATWTLFDNTCPITSGTGSYLLQTQLVNDSLLRITIVEPITSGTIKFAELTISGPTWSAVTNIGGGFTQTTQLPLASTQSAGVLRFKRGDGTSLIVYQADYFPTPGFAPGVRQIRILQESSGTWTQLASFASASFIGPGADQWIQDHYILWTGILSVAGILYIFANHAHVPVPQGGSFYTTMDLVCITVNTDNTVSAAQTIDTQIEQMPAATNPAQAQASTENGRCAISSDGKTIAFGYGYQTNTFPAGTGAQVRCAIGDISSTPLSPVWAVETVTTNQPKWNNGFSNDVSVSFDQVTGVLVEAFGVIGGSGNLLWCGFANDDVGSSLLSIRWATIAADGKGKLNRSTRTAINTWSAIVQLYPSPDASNISVDGFDSITAPVNVPSVTLTFNLHGGSPGLTAVNPPKGPIGPVTNPTVCINQT